MSKFKYKVDRWLAEEEPNIFVKASDLFWFWFYNKSLFEFSFWKFIGWLGRFAATASTPAITYYVYKRITFTEAAIAAGVLFALFSINSVVEQWLKRKTSVVDAASAETWIRVGDLITSVKSSATPVAERDGSFTATLGVIEGYARVVTKSPKSQISVSLALYDGNSTTHMKIKHRNPGNERPIGRPLKNLDRVLGHIACQFGLGARVVNDLNYFGRDAMFSPTQSSRNYRSLLLIPITSNRSGKVKGFVSVDCARPYAFYGNRAKRLVVTCEPLIEHIQEQC